MKLKDLQDAMIAAMKAKDKPRKDSISALVSAVKKAGIDAGCRDDIPEDMVNQVVLKELKSVKEQIDTCPASREDLLAEYKARYDVMSEFAPKNKGMIMKTVMGELKGKADGKVINQVVAELTK